MYVCMYTRITNIYACIYIKVYKHIIHIAFKYTHMDMLGAKYVAIVLDNILKLF